MNKLTNLSVVVALAFAAGACKYQNEFNGTYNSVPAKLSAYSKNIDSYCVSLTLESNGSTKNNFISAQDVFNPNDFLAPKSFNTKGTQCAKNQSEYLIGTRYTTVLSTGETMEVRQAGPYNCQTVYYKVYQYQEKIAFELHDKVSDQLVGTFEGTGQVDQYTDSNRPVRYGPIYACGGYYPRPYPGPGPYPYPGPRPYPGPGPRPYPGPAPHPYPGPRPF